MIFYQKLYQEDLQVLIHENLNWSAIKGKCILITGASGMVGTFLIDVLMQRNACYQDAISVYALSRNIEKLKKKFNHYLKLGNQWLHLIEHDVTKELRMDTYHFDYMIHAASNTHPIEYSTDPVGTITTNLFGAYHLLEYARLHKNSRMVLLSSVEVYGENIGNAELFDETSCGYINCNTVRAGYPESKRLSESLLQAYIHQYQLDGVIVRLCRIYGPTVEVDDSRAISQFIKSAVMDRDIVLKSNGSQLFSFCYISDAVHAILRCMTAGQCGEAYNVADSASNVSLKSIAEHLAEKAGRQVVFELPNGEEKLGYSSVKKSLLNAEKIKKLGWMARYSIQDGLNRTVSILKEERGLSAP